MTGKPKLTVELVPKPLWGQNLRSELTAAQWDRVRCRAYREAGYVCEICGGVGPHHPVECHERWEYDDHARVQRLIGLIALCSACHEVKHFGRAGIVGRQEQASRHLQKVNGWSKRQMLDHVAQAGVEWANRSKHENWTCDMSFVWSYLEDDNLSES